MIFGKAPLVLSSAAFCAISSWINTVRKKKVLDYQSNFDLAALEGSCLPQYQGTAALTELAVVPLDVQTPGT